MIPPRPFYPFSAIVGQEEMKQALILNLILPSIGGVLIRGEKGTAKSTAVRALASLLPGRTVVEGCQFRCAYDAPDMYCSTCQDRFAGGEHLTRVVVPMRVIELPLSATEDRVAGTLDIEHAIKTGTQKFQPGVLAEANGNILYVDEVNLLDDHLVDLLLDAAAMGVHYVEREGISFSHPARFLLVGTMNPEEGDLRPQLLDRFGLVVDVTAETDIKSRTEIIRRRLAFERDPQGFCTRYAGDQSLLNEQILAACTRAGSVQVPDDILEKVAHLTLSLGVDGHRADLTLIRAGIAVAALHGRSEVTGQDILSATALALPHRLIRRPFDSAGLDDQIIARWYGEHFSDGCT